METSVTSPEKRILDLVHLARQSFGDRDLEKELIALFEQQCVRLLPILTGRIPAVERGDAAHTLKGAARAVGAWRIAAVADDLERALDRDAPEADVEPVVADLERAIRDTRKAAALWWSAA